jgi:hypothetical protein
MSVLRLQLLDELVAAPPWVGAGGGGIDMRRSAFSVSRTGAQSRRAASRAQWQWQWPHRRALRTIQWRATGWQTLVAEGASVSALQCVPVSMSKLSMMKMC